MCVNSYYLSNIIKGKTAKEFSVHSYLWTKQVISNSLKGPMWSKPIQSPTEHPHPSKGALPPGRRWGGPSSGGADGYMKQRRSPWKTKMKVHEDLYWSYLIVPWKSKLYSVNVSTAKYYTWGKKRENEHRTILPSPNKHWAKIFQGGLQGQNYYDQAQHVSAVEV